jgi:hypothetical protein
MRAALRAVNMPRGGTIRHKKDSQDLRQSASRSVPHSPGGLLTQCVSTVLRWESAAVWKAAS